MTDPAENGQPVPVIIRNWADPIKPPYVKRSTFKTYIIDPTGATGPKNVPVCSYEPQRFRMAIQVIDAAVAVILESPVTSPDSGVITLAPQGLYLPPNLIQPYEFHGPDEMFLNALTAATRVTVLKEYC